ncbi:hypothetical protein [Gemmata sp.]|uniref:hypothetical protein n=1 Tax=Gemmata sp. TaxID=1914242 RepID=UPI003F70A842
MTPFECPDRKCPKCESTQYLFRARKTVPGPNGPEVETKYRCQACGAVWAARVPAPGRPEQREGDAA